MSQLFDGVIGRTYDESREGSRPSKEGNGNRPNVLIWLMDDVGFGQLSPYGGLVDTPALQRIADRGTQFTNGHSTPLCAPTRACLLTGRNHHTNNMASLPRFAAQFPGHDGNVPFENGFISEILQNEGYATFAAGKWHLSPVDGTHMGASRRTWPLGRGFDRFYGFMGGQTDQFHPHLVSDNHVILPPKSPEEGYHLSEDLVDQSIGFINDLKNADSSKPFLLYLAFGAGHSPHQAPKEFIEPYRGHFDMGWDKYRELVFEKQVENGIIPASAKLSALDPDVPRWETLQDSEKAFSARLMEGFAGMVTHMDYQVGRLLNHLERIGELDNTVIIVLSDNGASSEGGAKGALNYQQNWGGGVEAVMPSPEELENVGGPKTFSNYPWGWAWAGSTPFRRWKRETYRGGCGVPFIASWPGTSGQKQLDDQFVHVIDVVPTLLDGLGVEPPDTINGYSQSPIEGVSFYQALSDGPKPAVPRTQYFEMWGHRAIYHNGWRAVCPWPGTSYAEAGVGFPTEMTGSDLDRLEESGWELYNVSEDPSETVNLAATEPKQLNRLVQLWWEAAGRYKVLPLISKLPKGIQAGMTPDEWIPKYTYYPGTAPIGMETAVNTINISHRITADVEIQGGSAEGILLSLGDVFGGYCLFMNEGRLYYAYNSLGRDVTLLESRTVVAPGKHRLTYDFQRTGEPDFELGLGAPGRGRLMVDDEVVCEAQLNTTVPRMLSFTGTLTCGYHHGEPICDTYVSSFPFTELLNKVVVELLEESAPDQGAQKAQEEIEMACQ